MPALKKLPAKHSIKLKIEIQKLFLNYECSDDSSVDEIQLAEIQKTVFQKIFLCFVNID